MYIIHNPSIVWIANNKYSYRLNTVILYTSKIKSQANIQKKLQNLLQKNISLYYTLNVLKERYLRILICLKLTIINLKSSHKLNTYRTFYNMVLNTQF